MEAATLAYVAIAASAVSAGVAAYGSYQQGQAQESAAKYNAAVARNNARIQQQNARIAQEQAALDAERADRQKRLILGSQASAAAKSGRTISGSVTDINYDTALETELDELMAIYQGRISSGQMRQRASDLQTESVYLQQQGAAAKTASYWQAGGQILGGVADAAGGYYDYQVNKINYPQLYGSPS